MKFIFRFVGDPRGFVVEDLFTYRLRPGEPVWVKATVGLTAEIVLIDVQKAYVREVAR